MDYASAQVANYNNFEGLASLRAQAQQDQGKAVDKVAEQFEGMFLHMMLKEMRKTVPESVFFDSPSMKLFQDMQDQQVALDLAKEGPLGLATMLKANIAQQQGAKNRSDKPEGFALNPQAKSFAVNAPSKSFSLPQTQSVPRALNAYQAIELVR